jgi:hypothetical protein
MENSGEVANEVIFDFSLCFANHLSKFERFFEKFEKSPGLCGKCEKIRSFSRMIKISAALSHFSYILQTKPQQQELLSHQPRSIPSTQESKQDTSHSGPIQPFQPLQDIINVLDL